MLFIIIFLGFFFSWIWNIYWFTYQPYLEQIWINIKNMWIIYFFISLCSALGSFIIKKYIKKISSFSLLKLMFIILILISFMFRFFDNFFGIVPIILLSILFGFLMIFWNTYLIKKSPKTHKSTVLSIFSFAGSIWYFLFWSIAGYMIEFFTIDILYNFLPFFTISIFITCLFYLKQIKE